MNRRIRKTDIGLRFDVVGRGTSRRRNEPGIVVASVERTGGGVSWGSQCPKLPVHGESK